MSERSDIPGFGDSGKDFIFDAKDHRYLVDGEEWPSITSLIKEFDVINTSRFSAASASKGTAVHAACQYWDDQDLDENGLDQEIKLKLESWKKFRQETGFSPILELSEKPMISKLYRFGCTPDRIGHIKSLLTIVEIKSGAVNLKAAKIQTAAQYLSFKENLNLKTQALSRMVVRLSRDGFTAYTLDATELTEDCAAVAALSTLHWLKRSRG